MNSDIKPQNDDLKGKIRKYLVRSDFERYRTRDNTKEIGDVNMGQL